MIENLDFHFDGVSSKELGIVNVKLDTGLYEDHFIAKRTVQREEVRGMEKPVTYEVTRSPLSFTLTFAFEDGWNDELIRRVKRLLDVDYYKEFYFDDEPDRIIYCMPDEESTLHHNGFREGYFTITMVCNAPHFLSRKVLSGLYDCGVIIPEIRDNLTGGTFAGNGFSIENGVLKMRQLTVDELDDMTWGEAIE